MDELDRDLERLALLAQQSPAKTLARRRALTELTDRLLTSGQLKCKNRYGLSRENYEDILQEALQQTLLEIFQNIEQYNPSKGTVLGWARFLLTRRFIDLHEQQREYQSLDAPVRQDGTLDNANSVALLETIGQPEAENQDREAIEHLIQTDPTGVFQSTHIEERPDLHFRAIALRRLEKHSWKLLSRDWGVSTSTLSSFYQRCIEKFSPLFKEHI